MAYDSSTTIADIVKNIEDQDIVLPALQREFVWNTVQIEKLFDSIMQDFPIGPFYYWEISPELFREYQFYEVLKDYHQRDSKHNPKIETIPVKSVNAILDGQQRATSFYIGLKGTYSYKLRNKLWRNDAAFPERKLYFNLLKENSNPVMKYDFKFLTEEQAQKRDEEHFWFEVGKILEFSNENSNELFGFLLEHLNQEELKQGFPRLAKLQSVINNDRIINFHTEKSDDLDRILEIFIRVNNGGTNLTHSDLLLSMATALWEDLDAREEITKLNDELNRIGNGFSFNKDFILKAALVLSDFNNVAFKIENFTRSNMLLIEKNWEAIRRSLITAVELVSSFGFSDRILTSNNAIIPIAYYFMINDIDSKKVLNSSHYREEREQVKKWLLASLIKSIFSNQSDNVLRGLRNIIKTNGESKFPLEEIKEYFKNDPQKSIIFSSEDIEHLLSYQYQDKNTSSILMFLYKDTGLSQELELDHIFPKSSFDSRKLRAHGISEEDIQYYQDHFNDIGNLQLLPKLINQEKLNANFDEWFESNYPTESEKADYRLIHSIPDMNYSFENFPEFLEKRNALLKNRLKEILL